ncbi:Eco57I restriction-modification methylase domain-containing protein [uncultured Fusobacterium sp.]|uniref:Eco57I restriction-modification methylase domain-containing protein n=1 Tax=uncultured Fusobacterium sp. TaxID=159267 RepID=UPI00258647B6|nr:TaqI-like C-terminal specificity domain-containing protein [uncultured Fusobacterium sp.]
MKKQNNYSIYTPEKIASSMVNDIFSEYFKNGNKKQLLDNIRICDISCGSGNLLIPAVEKLLKLSKEIYGIYEFKKEWVSGFDLDEHALIEAKLKIKLLLLQYNIDNVQLNIQKLNSLELDNVKYNIIIGNPPYLGEKNNRELFQKIKATNFGKKYYESKMDYFYFFIEKAVELLESNGLLIYLTTNYWLRADSGQILRNTLKENGNFLKISIYDNSLFNNAIGQHNIIFLWKKNLSENTPIFVDIVGKQFQVSNNEIYDTYNKIVLADDIERQFNNKIQKYSNFLLDDLVNINQGIISGYDKAFVFDKYDDKFKEYLKPFYKNKDIEKYTHKKNQFWILYLDKNININPKLEEYLNPFYDRLAKRREVTSQRIKWWQLQWAREQNIFEEPKILVRQRCKTNNFAYSDTKFYGSADIYFITKKIEDINLFFILGYMNSKIFLEWFRFNGKFKGKNFEFYATPLKETPIYYPSDQKELLFIENLVKKQIASYDEQTQEIIDNYFYAIFNI